MKKNRDLNLLLIEDNSGDARLIREMLKESRLGRYECTVAENLTLAFSHLESREFDIILLDLNLPESSGIGTLDRIMGRPGVTPPVIVLTGLDDEAIGVSAIERGAEDYLVKGSIHATQLSRSIRYALERDKMTRLIRERERQWSETFNAISNSVCLIDLEGLILNHNKATEDMLGKTSEQIDGQYCYHVVHGTDTPIPECPIVRMIETKQKEKAEIRAGERWLEITVDPIVDDKNNIISAVHVIEDISGRKRVEESLRQSEEIFRQFMEHSPVYVFFKDAQIRSVRLSKNFEDMLGKPVNELLGKTMDELFPSDLSKSMIADDLRILKEGKKIDIEEELNGRVYNTIKFPIHQNGKPLYLAGFTIDVTEQKRAEKTLRQQLDELRRWQEVMMDREGRVIELKKEVNGLLKELGRQEKYGD